MQTTPRAGPPRWLLLLPVLLAGLLGCDDDRPVLPTVDIRFLKPSNEPTAIFRVEVASTPTERARGLKYRKHLGPNSGMLLMLPTPADYLVSSSDVPIPLDVVFLSPVGKVVTVLSNVAPFDDLPRTIGLPSQFIVLFPAGATGRIGLEEGDRALIQGQLPVPQ